MKLRLKDTQLVKAQNGVKELEKQIEEWRKAGNIPSETTGEPSSASAPAPLASAPTAGSPTAPVPSPSVLAPSPTTSARLVGPLEPLLRLLHASLPLRTLPLVDLQQQQQQPPRLANLREVVVEVQCGDTIGIRGAAAPGVGRGTGAPPQGPASGAPAGGVAIMGAASKRTWEEGEASAEDSLSKRLKPAPAAITPTTSGDGGASTGSAGSTGNPGAKPITLQRNRVQPS
jgi:nucleoprotein TPR